MLMHVYIWPLLYGLLIWWASTGLIMYLFRQPRQTFRWSFAGATLVLAACLWLLAATRDATSVASIYIAFTCGTLAWGWQISGFYLGYLIGPQRARHAQAQRGLWRLGQAIHACLYHELAALIGAVTIIALTWNGANQVGTWAYLILWGDAPERPAERVPGGGNFDDQLLPEHLRFLRAFCARKPMNLFFPLWITLSMVIAIALLVPAFAVGASAFAAIRGMFLGSVIILGIFEHWLLMLPQPGTAWGSDLRVYDPPRPISADIAGRVIRETER